MVIRFIDAAKVILTCCNSEYTWLQYSNIFVAKRIQNKMGVKNNGMYRYCNFYVKWLPYFRASNY